MSGMKMLKVLPQYVSPSRHDQKNAAKPASELQHRAECFWAIVHEGVEIFWLTEEKRKARLIEFRDVHEQVGS